MGEFQRIKDYLRPLSKGNPAALGLQDDVACLHDKQNWLISKDMLVENVHFLPHSDPALLAQKLLAVNLSDLAAKGAKPYGYMLGLALPDTCDDGWLHAFCHGLQTMQKAYDVSLLGGDCVRITQGMVLSCTIWGMPYRHDDRGQALWLPRKGAKLGDDIWVSGTIGDGYVGYLAAMGKLHQGEYHPSLWQGLIKHYHQPCPQNTLGQALVHMLKTQGYHQQDCAIAALDISDGLLADCMHLMQFNPKLCAMIEMDRIPLSPAAKQWLESKNNDLLSLLSGGDDYQLCFTARAQLHPFLQILAKKFPLTHIGKVVERPDPISPDQPLILQDAHGQSIPYHQTGYRHF